MSAMPEEPLSPDEATDRIRSVVIGFSAALVAVVIAFGITIGVVVSTSSSERDRICDVVADAFHEQALLFGEFAGGDDPRVTEYDEKLQARISSEC